MFITYTANDAVLETNVIAVPPIILESESIGTNAIALSPIVLETESIGTNAIALSPIL